MDSPAEVQSVYDFTVKVPTATLSFFYSSWKFGMCKALRFADHYHFILTSSMWKKNLQWYFIIFSWAVFFVTGHQWEWCFSECIQGQGSAHCQCCFSMVIRSFPPHWLGSSLQFAPWTVSPPTHVYGFSFHHWHLMLGFFSLSQAPSFSCEQRILCFYICLKICVFGCHVYFFSPPILLKWKLLLVFKMDHVLSLLTLGCS